MNEVAFSGQGISAVGCSWSCNGETLYDTVGCRWSCSVVICSAGIRCKLHLWVGMGVLLAVNMIRVVTVYATAVACLTAGCGMR